MQALMLPPQCPPHDAGGLFHRRACSDLPFRAAPADLAPGGTAAGACGVLPDLGSEDDLFQMYLDKENAGPLPEEGVPDLPPVHPKHRQTLSAGGYGYGSGEVKKTMAPEKLAELAIVDPKRVKRILANRQSAARSKERKARYVSDLERKVQAFQIEITALSAQLATLQRDTTGLATENNELKLRLQVMEQQSHLHDALNEALKNEVERLRFAAHQQQQQFSFYQPPQPQLCQPRPDFSGEQSHGHVFAGIGEGIHDMTMPREKLGKTQGLDVGDVSRIMQPNYMDELDVSNDSDMLQPENCTFSP